MTEAELQSIVADAAQLGGWARCHWRPARTAHGWRTPGQYEAAGFPDLLLVRPGEALALELKSQQGRATDDQLAWLKLLDTVPGINARLIRPTDCDQTIATLMRKP